MHRVGHELIYASVFISYMCYRVRVMSIYNYPDVVNNLYSSKTVTLQTYNQQLDFMHTCTICKYKLLLLLRSVETRELCYLLSHSRIDWICVMLKFYGVMSLKFSYLLFHYYYFAI